MRHLDLEGLSYFLSKLFGKFAEKTHSHSKIEIVTAIGYTPVPLNTDNSENIGNGITVKNGYAVVDTADVVEEGNAKPITSDAVYRMCGNIETLLSEI